MAPPDEDAAHGLGRRALLEAAGGAALATAVPQKASAAVSEIVRLDAEDLSAAIAARRLSSVEVMNAYLDHIERLNPRVNAIVALRDRGELLREAALCDEEAARGALRGPLHGLPHAPKDLLMVKGLPFTSGSPLYRRRVPKEDALQAARLRRAGAIFIGKTNTPEFGLGSHTYNPVYGVTLNAYDQSRSAGGSSGGAAAALALRLLPLADGSDFGGSLRNPAGWNNVFGFRTSFGLVPLGGDDVWAPSMSVVGPMARTVTDLARLLSVQAGYDQRAPLSLDGAGARFLRPRRGALAGVRIGWLGDFSGAVPYEAGVLELCEGALAVFRDRGCVVEPAHPDASPEAAWEAFVRLRWMQTGAGLLADYQDPARRALMKPEAQWEAEGGARLSAYDVAKASAARTVWSAAMARLFDRFDYLLAPTAQVFAFDAKETWPRQVGGVDMATYHEWMKGVCLVTLSGCPALAVPAGFTAGGAAMGLQIIAPVRRDLDCLSLALAYEEAAPWIGRTPALLQGQGGVS